jgi:hypothetical protein
MLIKGRFCHDDVTDRFASAEAAAAECSDSTFVDAPDFVFPGWGYDETADGDGRFIAPDIPDGYRYDCGCFVPDGGECHDAI